MEKTTNPLDIFQKEAPEVAEAFNGLIQALVNRKGLDQKTKQLIYIGIKASQKDTLAVKFHTKMAKNSGATRDEVIEAILISLTVCGISGVANCLPIAVEEYDSI